MSHIIKKYVLSSNFSFQKMELTKEARILSVVVKRERIYLFVEQDPNSDLGGEKKKVEIVMIGEESCYPINNLTII